MRGSCFEESEHNGNKFLVASGFPTKANGTQLLYSPEIDLNGKNKPSVSVNQTGRFYPKEAQELNLIEILIAETTPGKTVEEFVPSVRPCFGQSHREHHDCLQTSLPHQ